MRNIYHLIIFSKYHYQYFQTPMDVAKRNGKLKVVKLLEGYSKVRGNN